MQNPVFRLFFFGTLAQFAAMTMQMVTSPLLIYRLTESSALLGIMSLASAFPVIILSLFGGAIADRIQKKQILVMGLLCLGIIAFGISIALAKGYISRENQGSWWILLASSFLQGIVMGLMMPAVQAIIPELVSKEHATNAVALNMMGMNIMNLVAPALAGFLIDAYDFEAVYYTTAGLFLCSAVLLFFLPRTSRIVNNAGNILADIQQGIKYIRHDTMILFILVFTLFLVMLSQPYQQLLPIFVDDILKVGATGMGILMSVSGAGALVGTLAIASLPNRKRGLVLLLSGLVSGLGLVVFSFSTSWGLSLTFIVFVGLGQTIRSTIGSALLQSYTEAGYMGRVMSILMVQWGLSSLCTFVAGLMAEVIPVQWVLGGFAMILILGTFVALFVFPRIRKLD